MSSNLAADIFRKVFSISAWNSLGKLLYLLSLKLQWTWWWNGHRRQMYKIIRWACECREHRASSRGKALLHRGSCLCVYICLSSWEQKDFWVWKGSVLGRSQGLAWFRLCPERANLLCSQGFAASLVTLLSQEAPVKKQHVETSSDLTSATPCPSLPECLVTGFVIEIKDNFICETWFAFSFWEVHLAGVEISCLVLPTMCGFWKGWNEFLQTFYCFPFLKMHSWINRVKGLNHFSRFP